MIKYGGSDLILVIYQFQDDEERPEKHETAGTGDYVRHLLPGDNQTDYGNGAET